MNFLPAELENGGGAVRLASGQVFALPARFPGRAVTLGVRPENVALAQDGIPLQVELVEPLGSETLVHGRMADGTALLAKLQGAAPVGDAVAVALDPAVLHLFDRSTGERIAPIG
jgi:sn-glycerol 3-phosphate transport system ATP-binding protein